MPAEKATCSYTAMLQVASRRLTLQYITDRLGMPCDADISHVKGTRRALRRIWRGDYWRLDSKMPKRASLERHLDGVIARAPAPTALRRLVSKDCIISIQVGLFSDGWIGEGVLRPRHLAWAAEAGVEIQINSYP